MYKRYYLAANCASWASGTEQCGIPKRLDNFVKDILVKQKKTRKAEENKNLENIHKLLTFLHILNPLQNMGGFTF